MHEEASGALGREMEFLRELWALDHALHRRSKRMMRDHGVTGPQRLALRLISRFPGLTAGRLADLLHLHPSTVTGVISRLVEAGLILRRGDGPDRRRALLQITPKGVSVLSRPRPTVESAVTSALRDLSESEIGTAMKALRTVARHLASEPEPAPSARG